MQQEVDAIYERGVLRPLEPLAIAEAERVRVTVSSGASDRSRCDLAIMERARLEVAGIQEVPTIEEVRAALACIPGSLTEDVIAQRGDY